MSFEKSKEMKKVYLVVILVRDYFGLMSRCPLDLSIKRIIFVRQIDVPLRKRRVVLLKECICFVPSVFFPNIFA